MAIPILDTNGQATTVPTTAEVQEMIRQSSSGSVSNTIGLIYGPNDTLPSGNEYQNKYCLQYDSDGYLYLYQYLLGIISEGIWGWRIIGRFVNDF